MFVGLVDVFVSVFKCCEKGKDRYSKPQIQWHRQCSMLLEEKVESSMKAIVDLHKRWLEYCKGSGVNVASVKKVCNPIMISFCSAVYDYT